MSTAHAPDLTVPPALRRASWGGSGAALLVYSLLASAGRLQLADYRFTSDFYDVQARRLFDGHLTVPLDRFGIEAFVVDGHTHTYFGLLPALLRMPVLLVTDRFDGRLTQVFSGLAFVVFLWAVVRLSWRIRLLVRPDDEPGRTDKVVAALAPFVAGAGTTMLWLGATPVVYHEAILWGVAAATAAIVALLDWLNDPSRRSTLVLGAWVAAVLMSRPSLGFGTVAAVGLIAAALAARPVAPRLAEFVAGTLPSVTRRQLTGLIMAILVPMAAYVTVNEARFGRALGVPYGEQVWSEVNPPRQAALEANGGSLFNVGYAPSTALAYLRPDGLDVARLFPFVDYPEDRARVIGDVVFDTRDRTASAPATMPAATVLALAGMVLLVRTSTSARAAVLRPVVAGGAVAVVGVLTIGFVAQRYLGDLVPALVVLSLVAAHALPWRRSLVVGAALLIGWSIYANAALGLLTQRAYAPPDTETRHAFVDFQTRLDETLFGEPRHIGGDAPPAERGNDSELYVVGDCAELLWSDGDLWYPLEPTADGKTPICDRLVDQPRFEG